MTQPDYETRVAELLGMAVAIQQAKQPSYTRGSGDVLQNFKSAAQAAGITPEQAWVVFAKKQWDAICALMTQPDLVKWPSPRSNGLPTCSTTSNLGMLCGRRTS
jgi:hypothetical protein